MRFLFWGNMPHRISLIIYHIVMLRFETVNCVPMEHPAIITPIQSCVGQNQDKIMSNGCEQDEYTSDVNNCTF